MKISIIIPVYNVEKYVETCIRSCFQQDLSEDEFEIIVVNDGSQDGSLSIVNNLSNEIQNIRIFSQPNAGLSAARNLGLRKAVGDYVWFVDSDDWIEENCLKKVTDRCYNGNLDLLQICAANVYGSTIRRRFSYNEENSVYSGINALKKSVPFCAPFSIYKRAFLEENKLMFIEGIFHEDNEFTPRVFYYAQRVAALNDILYYVYQSPNSITRSINPKKAFDCIIVMNSLHDFMDKMKADEKKVFHYLITSTFNAAIHDTIGISKEVVNRFNRELAKNRHLYMHLLKSGRLIYIIEGFFLMLFPHNPVKIYHLMNKFDRRRIKLDSH